MVISLFPGSVLARQTPDYGGHFPLSAFQLTNMMYTRTVVYRDYRVSMKYVLLGFDILHLLIKIPEKSLKHGTDPTWAAPVISNGRR